MFLPAPAAGFDISARVDKVFEKRHRTDTPSCALSVTKDGSIIYKHGNGMTDPHHSVPVAPSSVFHVASMSKQLPVASIVLLAQREKLFVDGDIRKNIPELPDFGSGITVRQLIHHSRACRAAQGRLPEDLVQREGNASPRLTSRRWMIERANRQSYPPGFVPDSIRASDPGTTAPPLEAPVDLRA